MQGRAGADLGCDQAAIADLGAGAFEAVGCGRRVTYSCNWDEDNGRSCTREGAPEQLGSGERPRRRVDSPNDPRLVRVEELVRISERVEACSPRQGEVLYLDLTIDEEGFVESMRGDIGTADEQSCIEQALASVRIDSLGRQRRELRTSFPQPRDRSGGPAASSANPRVAWLEGAIQRNADAIRACVGAPNVAVRLSIAAGSVTWALQGAHSGTPEEECVQSVLAGEAPPAGADGTWVRVAR